MEKRPRGGARPRGERESVARVEDEAAEKEETRRTGRSLLRTVGGQIRRASGSQLDGRTDRPTDRPTDLSPPSDKRRKRRKRTRPVAVRTGSRSQRGLPLSDATVVRYAPGTQLSVANISRSLFRRDRPRVKLPLARRDDPFDYSGREGVDSVN